MSASWARITIALCALGCGSEESAGSSIEQPTVDGGSGGTSTMPFGGGAALGTGSNAAEGGAAGTGGVAGDLPPPRQCTSTPDPPCADNVWPGPFDTRTDGSVTLLEGVTEIEGSLTIRTVESLDTLSCLRRVGDNIEIDYFGESGATTLWGLRNVEFVAGSVDVRGSRVTMRMDCGLQRLASLGSRYLTGGAVDLDGDVSGELSLASLTEVTHIRISATGLSRIELPNDVTLAMGQLFFEQNASLREIAGFQGVTIVPSNVQVGGAQSVRIVDNPLLPTCRAEELRNLFIAAGYSEASMEISGNAPGCN